MKKISRALVVTAMAGGMALASATGASAGHCLAPAGEDAQPGFSYFGTDHVKESTHAEGEKVHGGTPGASNCNQTAQEKRADASKP